MRRSSQRWAALAAVALLALAAYALQGTLEAAYAKAGPGKKIFISAKLAKTTVADYIVTYYIEDEQDASSVEVGCSKTNSKINKKSKSKKKAYEWICLGSWKDSSESAKCQGGFMLKAHKKAAMIGLLKAYPVSCKV